MSSVTIGVATVGVTTSYGFSLAAAVAGVAGAAEDTGAALMELAAGFEAGAADALWTAACLAGVDLAGVGWSLPWKSGLP